MRKIDPTLEQLLVTEEGTFSNVFGSEHVLLVPPVVEVKLFPPVSTLGQWEIPSIVYPVSPHWQTELPPMQLDSDVVPVPLVARDDLAELQNIGWQLKIDTTGMLNDFLSLAGLTTAVGKKNRNKAGRKVVEKIREFVLKWGPLWQCRALGHSPFCYCSWTLPSIGWQQLAVPCQWAPVEETREFVDCAKEARAILAVASLLQEGREVPAALLDNLYISNGSTTQDIQKGLERLVNAHLVYMGGPTLSLRWNKDARATLNLRTGLGFVHVVWLEIAQILCHGKGMSQCDGCGVLYIREGRKPKTGQRNFCLVCRENNKGAKRRSAQQRRARERGSFDNNFDNNRG